jgi:hypothetical protein
MGRSGLYRHRSGGAFENLKEKRMRKFALLAVAVFALAGEHAKAGIVGFANEFSGGVQCANAVTGCATLATTSIAGGVHFTFKGTMTGTEFITGLYGNIDPFAAATVANLSGNTETLGLLGFQFAQNGFKADGDGWFDWYLDLSSNPPRFDGTDTLAWDLMGVTLAQIDGLSENGPVGKTGFQFAIHAQGLAGGGSGWDAPTPYTPPPGDDPNPVPEPGSLALAGLGLIGLGLSQRRTSKKAEAEAQAA